MEDNRENDGARMDRTMMMMIQYSVCVGVGGDRTKIVIVEIKPLKFGSLKCGRCWFQFCSEQLERSCTNQQ